MHILLIHQSFVALNEPGGTRHYELARNLVEKGHQVTVIASPVSYLTGNQTNPGKQDSTARDGEAASGSEENVPGLTILRAYTYRALHKSFVHRVFSFLSFMLSAFWAGLKVRKVDVVWGTSPPIFQAAAAWALARLKGTRFLLEIRDLWPAFAIAVGVLRNPFLIWLSEWLERFLYRHADTVMINSPGFKEHVQQRGARRIELVPNGADPRMFDPALDGAPFRQKNGLEGKFVVLYAGAHGMSNDLGTALEAGRYLLSQPEIVIVFLGDGKEKAALQQKAREMKLENVVFLPAVPKSEMGLALAGSDACLAILKPIALYATVYPNKVFDYMAAGKPVLLAIDGVIRQVVELAQAGVFVPPGDPLALAEAIRSLAGDADGARQTGLNGRRYIEEHFDRAVLANRLEEVMEEVRKRTSNADGRG
jgi:glycosyltransferase involved in cell wall biosynthesis